MVLRAGASKANITPKVGTPLAGYFHKRLSQGVHDPLFVNTLFLDDDSTQVALSSCDLLHMNRDVVQNARNLAEKTTGIGRDNILVCATHTHTGPVMRDSVVGGRDRAWEEDLARKIAETIETAQRNATVASIKIGVGKEDQCVFNRRYRMRDGTVATIPWRNDNRGVLGPRGPVDPEVGVITIEDLEGRLLCVLVNYTNHCDTVEGNMFSADYPGWLREVIRRAKGSNVVTIFTAGAQGDIKHVDVNAKRGPVGYEAAKYVGNVLGEVVLETLAASEPFDCRIRVVRKMVSLPIRQFSEREVEEARRTEKRWFADRFDRIYAKRLLAMAVMKERRIETEIQAMALDNIILIGVPGEMFVELGLAIKAGSPFRHTFIVGLANDQVPGYIVTSQAYEDPPSRRGIHNYEAQTTALAKGSGERIVEEVLHLLRSLA